MLSPWPRYEYIILDRIFEAAATVGFYPYLSSYNLHSLVRYASQYIQSAAPPAIVPSKYSLISITFLTASELKKLPIEALESTAIKTPSLKAKPKVVVP